MRDKTIEKIRAEKLIVIVRGIEGKQLFRLGEALYEGGIRLMEIAFDQARPDSWEGTADAIRLIGKEWKGSLCVGAGTVLTVLQAESAARAGAEYLISPNVNREVIQRTRELGLVSIPGAVTPTEIQEAYLHGADFVKVFPVGSLGPEYIKAVRAPLNHIPLLAVGGIDENNAASYLEAGARGVGVGGSLVNREWIDREDFGRIRRLAEKYCSSIHRQISS